MRTGYFFDPWEAIGESSPEREVAARVEAAEDELAERDAIQEEPMLPAIGSSERKVIDLQQERMIRGLIAGSCRRER